jgi:hypothetical protein
MKHHRKARRWQAGGYVRILNKLIFFLAQQNHTIQVSMYNTDYYRFQGSGNTLAQQNFTCGDFFFSQETLMTPTTSLAGNNNFYVVVIVYIAIIIIANIDVIIVVVAGRETCFRHLHKGGGGGQGDNVL